MCHGMDWFFNGLSMATVKKLLILPLVATLMLSGCHSIAVGPRPEIAVAGNWNNAQEDAGEAISADWWKAFGAEGLDVLIAQALEQNPDVRVATERVQQAELQMAITGASLFPSLNLSGSSGENRGRADGGDWQRSESSRVSLGASYEVDVWGRLSAGRQSAAAAAEASQYDFAAVQLSIAGAVASSWFQTLVLEQRIETAERNLDIARRVMGIVETRYENGVATGADMARQRASLLSQEASLLPLQLQLRQTRAALALLLGQPPQDFMPPEQDLMAMTLPLVDAGVPAQLIAQRPDLASAEAQLRAADADLAAARAALLPSVQLSASAGRAASQLFSLSYPSDSTGWSVSLAQTLFDGGRLRNQVRLSESRQRILIEQYRKAIFAGLQEVEDALDRTQVTAAQETLQQQLVDETRRSLTLSEVRYREGSDDLLSLLDAQRSLFQAEDTLIQQRLARLNAAVDLYKALGGGWERGDW